VASVDVDFALGLTRSVMAGSVAGASTQRSKAYSRNESARRLVCGGSGGSFGLQDRPALPSFVELALER